jgi:hypothetical protein
VGLPAAASSGVIAANTLTDLDAHFKLVDEVNAIAAAAGR